MQTFVFVLNLAIASAYVLAAATSMPGLNPILWRKIHVHRKGTRIAGWVFFVSCAFTHMELALHSIDGDGFSAADLTSFHMVAHLVVQAIASWAFLWGVNQELGQLAKTKSSSSKPTD